MDTTSSSCSSGIQRSKSRLLKCFCGCSEHTEEDIKRFYRLSTQETLINLESRQLLESFLKKNRHGDDQTEIEQYLEIYKKCEEYLKCDELLTETDVEILSDAGLSYNLEKEFRSAVRTGSVYNIERCLLRIQGNCRNEIEASEDFKKFKQALLDKLKQGKRT